TPKGKPQYQLVSIAPLGNRKPDETVEQALSFRADAAGSAYEHAREDGGRQKSIEMQTIIKAWGAVKAGSAVDPVGFATGVKAVWDVVFGQPEAPAEVEPEADSGDSDIPF
ncbi:MAG TPA: hypothetical protein VM537_13355, partial [Anaerolineae bacterium]|nr:hypothetical protein [Anaerolineae bacterium]